MTKEKHTEILISIRPKYAKAIIEGRKTVEYRRNMPISSWNRHGCYCIQKMWIYATKPIGMVLGIADVAVFEGNYCSEEDARKGCLTVDELNAYFKGAKYRWAIKIKSVTPFETPKTLEEIGVKRAPQSWMYIKVAK